MDWFSCLWQRRNTALSKESNEILEVSEINNVRRYSYREMRVATEDFSPANKIGEGGFGSVYKGRLSGGKIAAIKVLSAQSMQGEREFLTELKAISDIEHENLVNLYGYCVEGNHRILVYGYLENNSLAQTLLSKNSNKARWEFLSKDDNNNSIQFRWATRSKICIGIARGLEYLHEGVHPHIVHRDIKASNILLDKDLTPKISDFGLAKLLPANMTHVSTRVAGTIGYLAPEYAIRGHLTRKADIYGFGVLILEIISGRRNTDVKLAPEEKYLLQKTWELHQRGELEELIDPALHGDYDIEEACRFLKIGLLCTQEMPKLRPSMSSVVKMLRGEMRVDDEKITKPGIISDLKDLKVQGPAGRPKNTSSTASSGLSPLDDSSSSSKNTNSTSHQSLNFTGTAELSH